jgi:hypothetical protein
MVTTMNGLFAHREDVPEVLPWREALQLEHERVGRDEATAR